MTGSAIDESKELIADFVDEASGSLQGLAAQLDQYRANPENADSINAVFRAVHSIKGCAGFLELTVIKELSHKLENALDEVRNGRAELTADLERNLVLGFDYLEELLQSALEADLPSELGPRETELLARVSESVQASQNVDPIAAAHRETLAILGKIEKELATSSDARAQEWAKQVNQAAKTLIAGSTDAAKETGTPAASAADSPAKENPAAKESSAKEPAVHEKPDASAKGRYVRVKDERLDEFLNQVSSLFITGELFKDVIARMSTTGQMSSLVEEMAQVNRTLNAQSMKLQQNVVSLRRVAIAGLLSKFPRMARTLAEQLGKKIDVHVSGEDTEVDKSLMEDLDMPLTHMIRNVVDHALEKPEGRLQRGRSESGNLWLKAEQTRTHIRVVVQDDGRGIDPNRLRDKAVEKEILTRGQANALSDREAIDLIFHAGFSTADKVSEVSGRGVGMDVVRTNVQQHNGEVYIESQLGVGTTFTIQIPIRQAVLVVDCLMVSQSGQTFVIPFEHIREITQILPHEFSTVHNLPVVRVRGETYGAVSLDNVLGLPDTEPLNDAPKNGVLMGYKGQSLCLFVNQILGHRHTVINAVDNGLANNDKFVGVAQLGGGRLALVLSVPDIVRSFSRRGK